MLSKQFREDFLKFYRLQPVQATPTSRTFVKTDDEKGQLWSFRFDAPDDMNDTCKATVSTTTFLPNFERGEEMNIDAVTDLLLMHEVAVKDGIEEVACVSLPEGFKQSCYEDIAKLNNVPFIFVPRSFAESSTEVKQVIPYVLVTNIDGGILAYNRAKGGENRLHGKWSVGWGGHMNASDYLKAIEVAESLGENVDPRIQCIKNCIIREIQEELNIDLGDDILLEPLYAFQSDENDVGKVHLCLAFRLTLIGADIDGGIDISETENEAMWISGPPFPPGFDWTNLEEWSLIALNFIGIKALSIQQEEQQFSNKESKDDK